MRLLLLGSGGREHAFAWKLSQSTLCEHLFIAPGNAGTNQCGTNLDIQVNDFESIKKCCVNNNIDMLIVGPEEPLVNGLVDFLKADEQLKDLMIIGPSAAAAQLECSKAFAKKFMQENDIPTAGYEEFTSVNFIEGIAYLQQHSLPIVLKADGLAAGKGVVICQSHAEALLEFEQMLQHDKFGKAGSKVVVEEFLTGIELSVFVLTDGKNYLLLPEAKDYKRIGVGETGLNTGGMGAISPVPFADDAFMQKVIERIIDPTIKGFQTGKLDYKGFVFFGLIKVGDNPFVIEYNCRMGDPETEVVLPRIKNDLVSLLIATAKGQLSNMSLQTDLRFATTIVAVSAGYPNAYKKGIVIDGLPTNIEDTILFHSGTVLSEDKVVTNGGRVLCATALADDVKTAISKSQALVKAVQFDGKYFRTDIGFEFTSSVPS